ncbi:C40 family peptidase [Psychrobacillus sp. L4]|uniref:C40 family peptidase n=1 Tax=Psychrobacillus sp. L4 TaxID=3236892 RepID=UPI0036F3E16E
MSLKLTTQKSITILLFTIFLVTAPFAGYTEAASTVNSNELVATSKNLIGTKYRSGGTTPAGFDCSGFVNYVFDDLGIDLPRTSAGLHSTGSKVDRDDLSTGDLVFFNTAGSGVSHVGIYIGDGKFIHSSSSQGVKIDKLSDPYYWAKHYVGAKRVTNISVASNK